MVAACARAPREVLGEVRAHREVTPRGGSRRGRDAQTAAVTRRSFAQRGHASPIIPPSDSLYS